MTKNIILDSCVFNKLFLDEGDREQVLAFLEKTRDKNVQLLAPSVFTYEVLAVAASSKFGAHRAYELLSDFKRSGFMLVEMNDDLVETSISVSNTGHPKSGFPTFYDATYHALAIETKGMFLTSDHRHYAKTKKLGHVVMLENWQKIFTNE